MALAGEELPELGAAAIEAGELAGAGQEAEIAVALGRGDARAHVYFSDLGHEYVRINSQYRT